MKWKVPSHNPYPGQLAAALWLLRCAADSWAMRGMPSLSVEKVLAALVHTLLWNSWGAVIPLSLEQSLESVASLDQLFSSNWNSARKPVFRAEALKKSIQLLAAAAQSWSAGDPEMPPTTVILHELATVLYEHRLVQRPPPLKFED